MLNNLQPTLDTVLTLLWELAMGDRFDAVVVDSFGQNLDWVTLASLRRRWASRDASWPPQIQFLPSGSMPTALGAYAASTDTIYLNQDWWNSANDSDRVAVLLEELGHGIDARVNTVDTPGLI